MRSTILKAANLILATLLTHIQDFKHPRISFLLAVKQRQLKRIDSILPLKMILASLFIRVFFDFRKNTKYSTLDCRKTSHFIEIRLFFLGFSFSNKLNDKV